MSIKALPIDEVNVETQSDVGYSPMLVQDRSQFSNTNSTYVNNIVMELEARVKKFEAKNANGDPEVPEDPVYLLKIRDLEGRSSQTFSNSIKSLVTIDQKIKNRHAKPTAILSPLILLEKGNLKIELVLIYPPLKNAVRDARPLYQKCIETSFKSIAEALKDRRKKTISLANVPEEFDPFYLSYAQELKRKIDKAFQDQQLERINTNDFERSLISLLKQNDLIHDAGEDYFIVAQEPGDDAEVTTHIDYLNEGVEKIKDPILKVKVLDIIEKLKVIKEHAGTKIELNDFNELKEILIQKIKNNTIGVRTLDPNEDKKRDVTTIDFAGVLENIGIDPLEYSEKLQYELLTSLGGVLTKDERDRAIGLFVHPEYFIYAEIYLYEKAIHHPEYRKKVEWINEIKNNIIKDKTLKLLINQGIEPGEISKLAGDLSAFKTQLERKIEDEEYQRTHDNTQGYTLSAIHAGAVIGLYFLIGSFPWTTIISGIISYLLLRKKYFQKRST